MKSMFGCLPLLFNKSWAEGETIFIKKQVEHETKNYLYEEIISSTYNGG